MTAAECKLYNYEVAEERKSFGGPDSSGEAGPEAANAALDERTAAVRSEAETRCVQSRVERESGSAIRTAIPALFKSLTETLS